LRELWEKSKIPVKVIDLLFAATGGVRDFAQVPGTIVRSVGMRFSTT
jgi:hypothetical protein